MKKKDLTNIAIKTNATIIEAMKNIDLNTKGILLIVSENNKLLGTITDGDVRRAILSGYKLSMNIEKIYNRECIYGNKNMNINDIKKIFIEKGIKFLPILDEEKKIIDYFEIDDLIDYDKLEKENPVLIMAGGLGTRLRPYTNSLPKPMLKVGNKPILEIIIDQFKNYGFRNILISVNYKADVIENYFGDGTNWGVSIKYIRENKRLGTAGAIKLAQQYLDNTFFVINGDILTNANFYDLLNYHINNEYRITIGSKIYEMQVPYGVLNVDESCVTSIEEKPVFSYEVNGGIYVLNPSVIKNIPNNEYYDITQLIDGLLNEKSKIGRYQINEYWMDIGKIEDYNQANEDIKNF